MKLHYFEDPKAAETDMWLNMAKAQEYVPKTCLLGGQAVIALVNQGEDPCKGCNCDRAKCKGRPHA